MSNALERQGIIMESRAELLEKYLKTICKCYSSGVFFPLFRFLADDCAFESQWVLTPNVGKESISKYLDAKGKLMRTHGCCPTCEIVQLVGNVCALDNAGIHLNGMETEFGSYASLYNAGKLVVLMEQDLDYETNGVIIDIRLNDDGMISRINLRMPELFKYTPFAGPFEIDGEYIPTDSMMESDIKSLLEESEYEFEYIDSYIDKYQGKYSGNLSEKALRLAIRGGCKTYVEEYADYFDLNDGDGYSSYLYETDDEEMQKILMDHGAESTWDEKPSEGQKLLMKYLAMAKTSLLESLIIVAMLSTEESLKEMLEYIAKNHPLNPTQLYTVASEIAERMNSEPKD